MDDIVKMVGLAVVAGGVIVAGMIGYRVMNDPVLLYFVVGSFMLIVTIAAAGVSFLLLRHALEARRVHLDATLTSARILRTLDGVAQAKPAGGGGDLLTQLLTAGGVGADQVVDSPNVAYSQLSDDED